MTSSSAVVTCARAAAFAIGLAAISSCNRSPTGPLPGPGGPVTLISVRVSGPTLVAPGETVRYTATADYSDGSSQDVTATASWTPANSASSIYFTSGGVALAAHPGESLVSAFYGFQASSVRVLVLEPGTFKLSGVVTESGDGRLLPGVTVEVVSGTGRGLRATTDFKGRYALYGVAGLVQLRASADGFNPQVHEVVVTAGEPTDTFTLTPAETPEDVSGVWTMTLAPSSSCRAGLPDIAKRRNYQVQLIQQGTGLQVRTSSPTLQVFNPYQNDGTIFGSRVRLNFVGDTDYGDWSTPNLYDHLSPTETFGFDGVAEGNVTGSQILAKMKGDLMYWDTTIPVPFVPTWYCRAKDHAVTLRR